MREKPSSETREPPGRGPAPRENHFAIAAGAVALLAGVVVLAAGGGGTGASIAAAMLFGIAGVAFVSLIFLIVGQSEEADRRRHPRG
jgi:hypothetical protein